MCLFMPRSKPYSETELTATTLEKSMFFLVASIIPLSPVKILNNCGNSSMLIFRIHRPDLSMYCSGFSSICVGISCGVDIFMLRNLSKLNCVLCIPIFFCLKNTGPGSSAFMINAKTIIGKAKTTIPMKDNTISINRLKKCLYIFVETNFQKIIFYEKHPKNTAKAASRTCRMQLQALQHRRQSLLLPHVQKAKNILHLRSQFVARS